MNGKEIAINLEIAYQDMERDRMLSEAEYECSKGVLQVEEWHALRTRIKYEHRRIIEEINQ